MNAYLQKSLRPCGGQLLFQLGQALAPAEAAAKQISGVVQVAWGVERYPLLLIAGFTALFALLH